MDIEKIESYAAMKLITSDVVTMLYKHSISLENYGIILEQHYRTIESQFKALKHLLDIELNSICADIKYEDVLNDILNADNDKLLKAVEDVRVKINGNRAKYDINRVIQSQAYKNLSATIFKTEYGVLDTSAKAIAAIEDTLKSIGADTGLYNRITQIENEFDTQYWWIIATMSSLKFAQSVVTASTSVLSELHRSDINDTELVSGLNKLNEYLTNKFRVLGREAQFETAAFRGNTRMRLSDTVNAIGLILKDMSQDTVTIYAEDKKLLQHICVDIESSDACRVHSIAMRMIDVT